MKTTTMYLPGCADEVAGLLAETAALLLDARLSDTVLQLAPQETRPYDANQESPGAFAIRAWRLLVPTSAAGDARHFRTTYGWTTEELTQITTLLRAMQDHLRRSAPLVLLEGTAAALLRDADRLDHLIDRWGLAEVDQNRTL